MRAFISLNKNLKTLINKKVVYSSTSISQHLNNSNNISTLVEVQDDSTNSLRRVVMCNEKQRNSLGIDMIRSLKEALESIQFDNCRVLVISSAFHNIFSSGHNLKEFTSDKGRELHQRVFSEFTNLCLSLKDLPIPTIAEVHGLAAAAGCQLAASCDLVISSNKASFSTPGVKFGVFCSTPGVALTRNIYPKIAAKMLFTGEAISAQEALKHGLVTEIVDLDPENKTDLLKQRVNQISKQIATNSRFIVALGKKCFYDQMDAPDLNQAYKIACDTMLENLRYEDTQSGLTAFASKKKPIWSNSNKKIDF